MGASSSSLEDPEIGIRRNPYNNNPRSLEPGKGYDGDFGNINISTRYSRTFAYVLILMIVLASGVAGYSAYLGLLFTGTIGDKSKEIEKNLNDTEKYSFVTSLLISLIMIAVFIGYYWLYILPELRLTDGLVTDLVRSSTTRTSEESFKNNLGEILANKLGNRKQGHALVRQSIMFDPVGKFNAIAAGNPPPDYEGFNQVQARRTRDDLLNIGYRELVLPRYTANQYRNEYGNIRTSGTLRGDYLNRRTLGTLERQRERQRQEAAAETAEAAQAPPEEENDFDDFDDFDEGDANNNIPNTTGLNDID